jgi:putative transposase
MKTVPTLRVVAHDDAPRIDLPGLPEEVRLALGEIAGAAREGLLALSLAAGMAVMQSMFDAEITAACGPRGKHDPDRTAVRHGGGRGSVVLGGRRVPVARPPARTIDGNEVPLACYRLFAAEDQLTAVVMERMLAGLATRRHVAAAEPVGQAVAAQATATSRSAVSRRFIAATKTALAELLNRDLAPLDIKVLMVDGEHLAEHLAVVALAITADGTKVPVGLWEGSTENATVVTALLADLVAGGLDATDGLLVVIDGAKALSAAVRAVSVPTLPSIAVPSTRDETLPTTYPRPNAAGSTPNSARSSPTRTRPSGCATRKPSPPRWPASIPAPPPPCGRAWRRCSPTRLGITGTLARTLTTSNPIESMISIARTTNRNVTHWRDGQMVLRWTAAGMLNAQRSFRRVRGFKQMPQLVAALHRHAHPNTAHRPETVGTAA